ncbi:MAG TPA: helicase C-terminal domain-containing protein [Methylomirabilota bacterium]
MAHFPPPFRPRPEQARVLADLADAIDEAEDDPSFPRIFLVEAPPGVGKSHIAVTLARWSGDAYLLTSQKLLQDQYERDFGADLQIVKGRDNYLCERYGGERVTTSHGVCRRRRGAICQCPYARAKAAALAGPIFCSNTAYFLTLRQWQGEQLPRRRLLVIDEAHGLEGQLVSVLTVAFPADVMKQFFGGPLPRLGCADEYRPLLEAHADRLRAQLTDVEQLLEAVRPARTDDDEVLTMPPSRAEQELLFQRDALESALARLRVFADGDDREWAVRYPERPEATLELVPLDVATLAHELLGGAATITVLCSAYLGRRETVADAFGLGVEAMRAFAAPSPFPLEQRPLVYRPVGRLSKTSLPALEPALFDEVAAILSAHPAEKGLIHAASYASAQRLLRHLAERFPTEARRIILAESSSAKPRALDQHRESPRATVLLSPSLREGVDLPDDFLRFQIVTKMPYPDLGDPWTAARRARDPRWYAMETAKALVQAYGRACRHADDSGVTYVLDAHFERFVAGCRVLLPPWFLEAADQALREGRRPDADDEVM